MIHSRVKAEKALRRSLHITLPGHKASEYNWAATCVLLDVVQPMLKVEAESHKKKSVRCDRSTPSGKRRSRTGLLPGGGDGSSPSTLGHSAGRCGVTGTDKKVAPRRE